MPQGMLSILCSQRAQAVLHQNPDITTHDIDIFTCASDFGNLSHCVHGVEQTFRFVMEAVGGTVFFVRRENSPTLLIPGIRGYGHNFVDEYTAWGTDVKGSTSHQGLRFALRFQSDRFIEKEEHKARATPNSRSPLDALADASIDTNKIPDRSALAVEEGKQRRIPQNDVRDIKTRYMGGLGTRFVMKDTRAGINSRLRVSQIPTLIIAFHKKGVFRDIRKQDVREELENGKGTPKISCGNWQVCSESSLTL
ncbi:hypothetical protein MferCBS49748_000721 [Microsporum ferrugineum]